MLASFIGFLRTLAEVTVGAIWKIVLTLVLTLFGMLVISMVFISVITKILT